MSDVDGQSTIFLSYAHADKARAQRLAAALEQAGYTVWWDALIEGGSRFTQSIDEALERADAVIVLWSKSAVDSDWVRDEASIARDRRRLVPVSLDGCTPPLGFRQYQTINFAHERGRAQAAEFQSVLRAVEVAINQAPAKPGPLSDAPLSRRMALALAGGATVAAIGGVVVWRGDLLSGGRTEDSLAVLGFKNLSGDPSQDYLSAGLTEQVRTALSRVPALKVLAATSSEAGKSAGGPKEIAGKLGVENLLDGSIQRLGERVRVAVTLTDGRTGFAKWSQSLDRQLTDIFAFQSEIARLVAGAMSVQMATDEPVTGGTRNVRAYEEYLKGRALYLAAKDEASDRQAMAHYEVALGADPNFALAHAALSRVLASLAASRADSSELKGLYDRAIDEANKAVQIAPKLAEGQLALGYALFSGRLDMKAARPAYDKAAKFGAGDADILLLYGLFVVRLRRFVEARDTIGRALALDPLNPRTWRAAGMIDLYSGRPREAVPRLDRALALNPSMSNAHALKGYALILLGQWDEARKALDREPTPLFRLAGLAILAGKIADPALAQSSFDELVAEEGDAALYQQAQVLAQSGRSSEALDRLERARIVGDAGLTALATDPFMAPLAKEPRYRALVRSIGFA